MDSLVEFRQVSKRYGDLKANDRLSFKVRQNSIHALVGENGAGKSTAMKILFGMEKVDEGQVLIDGQPLVLESPQKARALGLGMVHQHFVLASEHTALDNVLFSETKSPFQILQRAKKKIEYQALAERYGFRVPWDAPVSNLSVGEQQRVEILKVLQQQARILILDEPTAVLTPQEIQEFFDNLRRLKDQGCTIILITHKLKEVLAICDEVTVIRQGQSIGTRPIQECNEDILAEMMVGRRVHWTRRELQLQKTSAPSRLPLEISGTLGLDLQVQSHEILGIAGVEGNGQAELIERILNPRQFKTSIQGENAVRLLGESIDDCSTSQIRMKSLGVFPEDRLRNGSVPPATVIENFILGYDWDPEYSRGGWLDWSAIQKSTESQMKAYDIRPRSPELALAQFSGGNQQKIVVARELHRNPEFILATHPTRGVDVGAVEFIHEQILNAQERGAGVLLISLDLDELLKMSTRILVLFNRKFVLELNRREFDEIKIGRAMGGWQEL